MNPNEFDVIIIGGGITGAGTRLAGGLYRAMHAAAQPRLES